MTKVEEKVETTNEQLVAWFNLYRTIQINEQLEPKVEIEDIRRCGNDRLDFEMDVCFSTEGIRRVSGLAEFEVCTIIVAYSDIINFIIDEKINEVEEECFNGEYYCTPLILNPYELLEDKENDLLTMYIKTRKYI